MALGVAAQAPTVDCDGFSTYTEDFESQVNYSASPTSELSKTTWAGWTVFDGTVDMYTTTADTAFTSPVPGFTAKGINKFVDLDGSSNHAGFFYHNFGSLPPGQFTLSFSFAGSQRLASP